MTRKTADYAVQKGEADLSVSAEPKEVVFVTMAELVDYLARQLSDEAGGASGTAAPE